MPSALTALRVEPDTGPRHRFQGFSINTYLSNGDSGPLTEGDLVALTDRALHALAGSFALLSGPGFYQAVCRFIVDELGLDYAFVGLLQPDGTEVRALSGWAGDKPMQPFAYALQDTPCATVIGRSYAIYPEAVQRYFPADELLVQMGIEAYVGAPLFDRKGQALGIMVALSTQPIGSHQAPSTLLPLFVESISAEIQRSMAEESLRQSETSFRSIFNSLSEAVCILDREGRFINVNAGAVQLYGQARDWFQGKRYWDIAAPGRNDLGALATLFAQALAGEPRCCEYWGQHADGSIFPTEVRVYRGYWFGQRVIFALAIDITGRKAHQQQLEYAAHFDALTTLPNRNLLAERLHAAIARAYREGRQLTIAYIDLDGFKAINDRYGHAVGDRMLIAVAQRMQAALRSEDTIARLGGDEFVAILGDCSKAAEDTAKRLQPLIDAAAEAVVIDDLTLALSASIGVAIASPHQDMDADLLLRQADQAMYQAKLAGRNRFHCFDAEHDRALRNRQEHRERIRRGLEANEFVLYYQPKVDMRSGEIIGVEALIRWQHPEHGLLPPARFLPDIAGQSLDLQLGDWVLDAALAQIRVWREKGLHFPVSVNISGHHLEQPDFVARLRTRLDADEPLPRGTLELEILESTALEDIGRVSALMTACAGMGVDFALDDFGTGYSSLTYLKRLPAELLKIDQSFIRDMLEDPDDLAILEGILGLARAFRRRVIAEGVETLEHGRLLLQLGCVLGQGYGIARPMAAEDLPGWAARWRPDPLWRQTQALDQEDIPLVYAVAEHRAWFKGLEDCLSGEREPLRRLGPTECHFSRWLQQMKAHSTRAQRPALGSAEALHREFCQRAEILLERRSMGHRSQVLADLPELRVLHERLLEAFGRFL